MKNHKIEILPILCPSCSGNHTRQTKQRENFSDTNPAGYRSSSLEPPDKTAEKNHTPDDLSRKSGNPDKRQLPQEKEPDTSVDQKTKETSGSDFDLSVIMKKPIKELKNHEKYLRYKKTFDENSKKQSKKLGKEYFADASRKYAHSNKDKINEKAKRVYNKDKTKALVRAKTRHYHKKKGLCQKCGLKGKTDFHHPPPMSPNVFIEVCNKCHNEIHGRELYVKQ